MEVSENQKKISLMLPKFFPIPIITSYYLYFLETTIDFDASALLTTNLQNYVPDKIQLFVSLENPVDPRISLPSVCTLNFTKI